MNRTYELCHDWYESVFDMAKEAGAIMGIDIGDIQFSSFWSQGDGASFTGSYAYAKGSAAAIRKEFPTATDLHDIADTLAKLQRPFLYGLTADIQTRGRYGRGEHSGCVNADVELTGDPYGNRDISEAGSDLQQCMREFADWIYDRLESEYEYQEAWQRAAAWQDLAETAAHERAAARQLIGELRAAMKAGITASPLICTTLRAAVRRRLEAMAEVWNERETLESDFWYRADGKQYSVTEFAAEYC